MYLSLSTHVSLVGGQETQAEKDRDRETETEEHRNKSIHLQRPRDNVQCAPLTPSLSLAPSFQIEILDAAGNPLLQLLTEAWDLRPFSYVKSIELPTPDSFRLAEPDEICQPPSEE